MPEINPLRVGDPQRIGPYLLTGRLGTGRHSVVYHGRKGYRRTVAIKTLDGVAAADPAVRARLARQIEAEAGAARRFAAHHIAAVVDVDLDSDSPHVVREHFSGMSLQEVVERDGPYPDLPGLAISTAITLTAIHRARVVHGDLTPRSILVGPYGPRLIDFGTPPSGLDGPADGRLAGPPDIRCGGMAGDMHAWACCMIYAATGRQPSGEVERSDLAALPRSLRRIVVQCLALDPARRPTAQQVFERLLREPLSRRLCRLAAFTALVTFLVPQAVR